MDQVLKKTKINRPSEYSTLACDYCTKRHCSQEKKKRGRKSKHERIGTLEQDEASIIQSLRHQLEEQTKLTQFYKQRAEKLHLQMTKSDNSTHFFHSVRSEMIDMELYDITMNRTLVSFYRYINPIFDVVDYRPFCSIDSWKELQLPNEHFLDLVQTLPTHKLIHQLIHSAVFGHGAMMTEGTDTAFGFVTKAQTLSNLLVQCANSHNTVVEQQLEGVLNALHLMASLSLECGEDVISGEFAHMCRDIASLYNVRLSDNTAHSLIIAMISAESDVEKVLSLLQEARQLNTTIAQHLKTCINAVIAVLHPLRHCKVNYDYFKDCRSITEDEATILLDYLNETDAKLIDSLDDRDFNVKITFESVIAGCKAVVLFLSGSPDAISWARRNVQLHSALTEYIFIGAVPLGFAGQVFFMSNSMDEFIETSLVMDKYLKYKKARMMKEYFQHLIPQNEPLDDLFVTQDIPDNLLSFMRDDPSLYLLDEHEHSSGDSSPPSTKTSMYIV